LVNKRVLIISQRSHVLVSSLRGWRIQNHEASIPSGGLVIEFLAAS
jgi:hypothetical protein